MDGFSLCLLCISFSSVPDFVVLLPSVLMHDEKKHRRNLD